MFKTQFSDHFLLLDIGTNKIVFVEYMKNKENSLELINWNQIKTSGIDSGKIFSIEQISESIRRIFSNIKVKKDLNFIISISEPDLVLKKCFFDLKIDGHKISKKDIRNVFSKNLKEILSPGKLVLHTIPQSFFLDDKQVEKNPIGLACNKLGLRSLNLLIKREVISKYIRSFKESKIIEAQNFIYSGLATAISSLNKKEKENGATSVDFGAGTVKIVTFYKNSIEFIKNIPLGGNNVTNDISKILEIKYHQAEYIKLVNGNLGFLKPEKIKIEKPDGSQKIISSNFLQGIIKPRYEEIIEICRDVLEENIISRSSMDTIVFSGGGSEINGFRGFASKILNRNVRIDLPKTFDKRLEKPEFAALNGVIKICNDPTFKNILINKSIVSDKNILERLNSWILDSIS